MLFMIFAYVLVMLKRSVCVRHVQHHLGLHGFSKYILRLTLKNIYPGKRPQTVCVRSVSRKSRDPDAVGSREVMVVMK